MSSRETKVDPTNDTTPPPPPAPSVDHGSRETTPTPALPTHDTEPLLSAVMDLPMLHIAVPYPSTFSLLHHYLYAPDPARLLYALLDLPPHIDLADTGRSSKTATPSPLPAKTPVERMASLPVTAIFSRLQTIHKLWSNVVCLGIDNELLWKAMERAWSVTVQGMQAQRRAASKMLHHHHHHHDHSSERPSSDGPMRPAWSTPEPRQHVQRNGPTTSVIPPLPCHPSSAGLQSTGHVMGLAK